MLRRTSAAVKLLSAISIVRTSSLRFYSCAIEGKIITEQDNKIIKIFSKNNLSGMSFIFIIMRNTAFSALNIATRQDNIRIYCNTIAVGVVTHRANFRQ